MDPTTDATQVRTFLIADVRGYTQFTVEQGDAAAARLARRFAAISDEVVAVWGGSVIELRGDEALAVFDSARQAIRAALDLQRHFTEEVGAEPSLPLHVGIGLDTGEAIPVDGGFRGAALNLAARLCSLAGPGEVLASETVASVARRLPGVTYNDRGFVDLKGFSDPVRFLSVTTEQPAVEENESGSDNPDSVSGYRQQLPEGGFVGALAANPLVGRRQQLEQILATVEAVDAGSGRFVVLAGEAGAGKTRLAQEATLEVRNRGFIIAAGTCFESRQSVAYYPFVDVLSTLYALAASEVRDHVRNQWSYLGRLLPEVGSAGQDGALDGEEDREQLFRAITSFVKAMADRAPIALLVDDLHWADEATLDLIQHLARHTRGNPVLMLAAYRDVEVQRRHPLERVLRDLHRADLVERVAVRRLGPADTAALVALSFDSESVSEEFGQLIFERTEGNPFFVQEVMRALVERGDVYQVNGHWERREVQSIEVPESVRSAIGERVSRLPEETQLLLRQASVFGLTFPFEALLRMSKQEEPQVESRLEEAMAAGVIRENDRDSYAFNHSLMQQTIYAELSERRKHRLHLAAAEILESRPVPKQGGRAAELAWHFLRADDQERSLKYSLLAGDHAARLFADSDAAHHYRNALELATEGEDRPRMAEAAMKLATTLWARGDYDEAVLLFERAAELYAALGEPVKEGRARQVTIYLHKVKLRHESAAAALRQVENLLGRIAGYPPDLDLAMFYHFLSRVYVAFGSDDNHRALDMANRAVEAARVLADEVLLARMEIRQADIRGMAGGIREAIATAELVMPRAEASGDQTLLEEALDQAAEYCMLAGEFERSRRYRERVLEVTERSGKAFEHAFALLNLAQIDILLGAWGQARELAERGLRRGEALDHGFIVMTAQFHLAQLATLHGNWDQAMVILARNVESSAGTAQMGLYYERHLAELDLLRKEPNAVIARLEPLVRGAQAESNDLLALLPILAWAYLDIDNIPDALGTAKSSVERADAQENSLALVDALRVLGMVYGRMQRMEDASGSFQKALALARQMPQPYAEARTLTEWGMLQMDHNAKRAVTQLDNALAIFVRLGAEKDADRVRQSIADMSFDGAHRTPNNGATEAEAAPA